MTVVQYFCILWGFTHEQTLEITEYTGYKKVAPSRNTNFVETYAPLLGLIHFLIGFIAWFLTSALRIEPMRLGRYTKRIQDIKEIFERHRTTTFAGVNVSIVVGTYGGYIGLVFDWKKPAKLQFPRKTPLMGYEAPSPEMENILLN